MVKTLTLKNSKIYSLASDALSKMNDDVKFPAKSMFYIQKNMNTIISLGREIDDARTKILERYGTLDESKDQYSIGQESLPTLQKELDDLFNLEQEVKIYPVDLDSLGDVTLNNSQMRLVEIMVEEPEE